MSRAAPPFDERCGHPFAGDKIDLQLRTGALDEWATHLAARWPFDGPEVLPWGRQRVKVATLMAC
ncbi:MAG TPA: hypothetical protein VGH38_02865 [Bryobacteraceae bacterium]|jgi:hypothetical protein